MSKPASDGGLVQQSGIGFKVEISVVEIYNDRAYDLLLDPNSLAAKKDRKPLEIRQLPDGQQWVEGLTKMEVVSAEHVLEIMRERANVNRSWAATAMNAQSSRSHSLLFVDVTSTDSNTKQVLAGKLVLIDLAGSERVKRSEAVGDRMKEAQAINKSLSALGDVIHALQSKAPHVPFRNSKLTWLLADCLSAHAKCLMFCNISPAFADVQETQCSLLFAQRVSSVKLGEARRNLKAQEEKSVKALPAPASQEPVSSPSPSSLEQLQSQLTEANDNIAALEARLQLREKQVTELQFKQAKQAASRSSTPSSASTPISGSPAPSRKSSTPTPKSATPTHSRTSSAVIARPKSSASSTVKSSSSTSAAADIPSPLKASRIPTTQSVKKIPTGAKITKKLESKE